MGSPAFAERLEAPVTVRRAEFHGEDLAQFAVEVGRFGLRQLPDATEHRQQAALQIRPEAFLLAVLAGAVRQRQLVDDPPSQQSLRHLAGDHGRAVVGQQGAVATDRGA